MGKGVPFPRSVGTMSLFRHPSRLFREEKRKRPMDDKRPPGDDPPGATLPATAQELPGAHDSRGERIGAYRLESRLGRGGMGEVFLAWDDRLKRRVAIKRIRHDSAVTSHRRERFRREAQAAAGLNHPSIVQIYDIADDGSGDCIVMEYVEGRTLASLLAGGAPLDAGQAARLAREVAEGLAAAHEAGFIHRDLKAENVIVTPSGHVKILDFGLVRSIFGDAGEESLTADGTVLGTYHAMSPEQASGDELDQRSDLFSLGVLLYEMLTGRSPFRGANPLDTLKKVISEHPPAVAALRPGLPPALSSLVDRLLAKDRWERPANAREVVRLLEEIATPESSRLALGESVSDLPTISSSFPASSRGAAPAAPAAPRSRRIALAAGAALALGLAAAGYWLNRAPAEPIRIAVPAPAVSAPDDERLRLAASGVLTALQGGLATFDGLAPLDSSQLAGTTGTAVEQARMAAADEVLSATIEKEGAMARVSLRRLQVSDGRVLWTGTFKIPTEPQDLRLLEDAVAVHLGQAFPDHSPRAGTPRLEVRDADYIAFLEVKQRVDSGLTPLGPELEHLERILRRSPRFLEAHLQAAAIGYSQFRNTRELDYLDRAQRAVEEARRLAPNDPRPLVRGFQVALARNRAAEAAGILARLQELQPGDPEILVLRAKLAEQQDRPDGALADLRTAVARAPSWRNLYQLADLEYRRGLLAEARQDFAALLARSPRNIWGLEKLAEMELMLGSPERAEGLYQRLLGIAPQRSYYTNLGLSRFLLGRHEAAVAAYRRARELAPGHIAVSLNLADAELALGHREEARALYAEVLAKLEEQQRNATLEPTELMMKAQCLAHLGRSREAVEASQLTLQQYPKHPEVVYLASLVYAIVGDRASSLVNVKAALEQGTQPRWFNISGFDPLRGDPEFQALLAAAPARPRTF